MILLVVPDKGIGGLAAMIADLASFPELVNQTCDVGTGEPRYLDQIVPDQALVGFTQPLVARLAQGVLDPVVGIVPGGYFEIKGTRIGQEAGDLVEGLQALRVYFHDHHPLMIPKPAPSGSPPCGKAGSVQAHVPLGKAETAESIKTVL